MQVISKRHQGNRKMLPSFQSQFCCSLVGLHQVLLYRACEVRELGNPHTPYFFSRDSSFMMNVEGIFSLREEIKVKLFCKLGKSQIKLRLLSLPLKCFFLVPSFFVINLMSSHPPPLPYWPHLTDILVIHISKTCPGNSCLEAV